MGMANANSPFGLKPIMDNGTPWSGQGRKVYFPASEGNNIFLGDPIIPLGGSDAFGVPAYGLATAGATNYVAGGLCGLANGPAGSNVTLLQSSTIYRLASTIAYGFLPDDPNQLYTIQEDSLPLSAGFLPAASAAMDNCDLIAGAGSTVTAMSGWLLDSSTVGTGSTKQIRILELTRGPDNAIGNYAKWTVRININSLWNPTGI